MKVHLASNLYHYTGDRRIVTAEGDTLAALLEDLDQRYPGLRFRVVDEQGRIRPHIRMFVGEQLTASLDTPLDGTRDVSILAALSGG